MVDRASRRSDTAEASRSDTAAGRRAHNWRTSADSCAGDTAARTGQDGEEHAAEEVASFAAQGLVHGQGLLGGRGQELPPADLRSCQLEGASLRVPAVRVLLLGPAVCSAQPADGG